MTRTTAVAVALALLAVLAAVPLAHPGPGSPSGAPTETPTPAGNESATTDGAAAGEHLAGSLSAHEESVDRDLGRRTLAARVDSAPDAVSKARALAGECGVLRERMRSLRERTTQIEHARENGSLTPGEFRAEMTSLEADIRTVADLAAACRRHGERLPADVANETSLNVSEYGAVGRRATNVSRNKLADHAFELSGNETAFPRNVNDTLANDSLRNASDDQREALAEAEAELEIYRHQREQVGSMVNETAPDDREAQDALACADEALAAAGTALDRARSAAAEGDDATFDERMASARDDMREAETCLERAAEAAGS